MRCRKDPSCAYLRKACDDKRCPSFSPTPVIGGREEPDGCSIHGKRGCGDPADCCACAMGDSPCAYHEHFGCETELVKLKSENARLEALVEQLQQALSAAKG